MKAGQALLTLGLFSVAAFGVATAYTLYKDDDLRNQTIDSVNNFKHAISELQEIADKQRLKQTQEKINNAIKSKNWKNEQWTKLGF